MGFSKTARLAARSLKGGWNCGEPVKRERSSNRWSGAGVLGAFPEEQLESQAEQVVAHLLGENDEEERPGEFMQNFAENHWTMHYRS